MRRVLSLLAVLALYFSVFLSPTSAAQPNAPSAVYTVTTTSSGGAGSLRQAILNANGNPGTDTIHFNIGGAGVRTISISTLLPTITQPVIIDGTTQPGYTEIPLIQLSYVGTQANNGAGLNITAGDSEVRGLIINGFVDGIRLSTGGENIIEGNFLGTNAAGTAASANEYGLHILDSPGNFIGGTGSDASNLISGNSESGIFIEGAASIDNIIQQNFIGTNAAGTGTVPNSFCGIEVEGAVGTLIGGGATNAANVISGNAFDGILLSFDSTGSLVRGNFIGTDETGELDLGNGRYGIRTLASNSNSIGGTTVARRNIISGNGNTGISIGGDENTVQGNYIGTNVGGTTAIPNGEYGISIVGSINNTIGGPDATGGNLISANTSGGIRIFGGFTGEASGNLILSNLIGTTATGTGDLGNSGPGISIEEANNNTVGGDLPVERNIISGNGSDGVRITGSFGNTLQGNFIGTTSAGNTALANGGDGVLVQDSSSNTIGGVVSNAGNIISGNASQGVALLNADLITVQGNHIGVGADGNTDLGNGSYGLHISNGQGNLIGGTSAPARNIISGNTSEGILIEQTDATGNLIQGNHIGTNAAGTMAVPNSSAGISIANSATGNTIGGTDAGAGNLISGNTSNGVHIFFGSHANRVQGNRIGTNADGTAALPNIGYGVFVDDVSDTLVGGPVVSDGNLISGNTIGVAIIGTNATANTLQNNIIGLNPAATAALGNAQYGILIESAPNNVVGPGNIISGNGFEGVLIDQADSIGNIVQGNRIGTDGAGTTALGNSTGVTIANGAEGNTIGGTTAGMGNLISGNENSGILLLFNVIGNFVVGNLIGTDVTGEADLGNGTAGIIVDGSAENVIGGIEAGARNIISGNNNYGVYISDNSPGNQVMGNYIGTDKDGETAIPNDFDGVNIGGTSVSNIIGGEEAGAGNLISGNGSEGVEILFSSNDNQILGNRIGTNATGTAAIPNTEGGIYINSARNIIGGTTASARNIISGNAIQGIYLSDSAENNQLQGNYIGTNAAGTAAVPNTGNGISIVEGANNVIGGATPGAGNLISGNAEMGLYITGQNAEQNTVLGNRIGTDASGTIAIANGVDGVRFQSSGPNRIGGVNPGEGNTIAFNTRNGVSIIAAGVISSRKAILDNSIFENGLLGIDLEDDGVTPNDEDDVDGNGGNLFQNFPVLNSAESDGDSTLIEGTFNSTPSTAFRLEFFSNAICDASGFGEGETFLGAISLSTNAEGDATISTDLPVAVADNSAVTATATDSANNTSEFSECILSDVAVPTSVQMGAFNITPSRPFSSLGVAFGLVLCAGVVILLRKR